MFPSPEAGYWITVLQIAGLAFLFGVLISRVAAGSLPQPLKQRVVVVACGVLAVATLIGLTFGFVRSATTIVGIAVAATAIATGLLLLRRQSSSAEPKATAVSEEQALLAARLAESEGLYRAIAETASDAIVISQDSRIVFANPAAARLVGIMGPETLIGRSVMEFIVPDKQALARERTAQMLAGASAPLVESRYLKVDGTETDVEISSTPFVLHGRPAIVSILRDISERKRVEQALRRSETRFRGLTELSSDWYWEQDEQYRVTFISDRYSAKTGLKMTPTLGQTRFETDNIWVSEAQKRLHRDDLESRRPFHDLRLSRYDEDGELHYFSISGRPIFNDKGRYIGYYGIGRDITEQQRVETAMRESEARFRSLNDLSSDWYWEQDEALRYTERCSDGIGKSGFDLTRMIGRRREEIPYFEAMTEEEWRPLVASIYRHDAFRGFVLRARNNRGQIRYLNISGEPFFHLNGRFAGYRGTGTDVTERERERAELQLFRTAMETSTEAIFITDMHEMRHVDVNETACRMLGYTRDELLRLRPYDLTPSLSRADFTLRYEEARRAAPDGFSTEMRNRIMTHKDGRQIAVEIYRRYLHVQNRELIVSVIRDISARIAADNALRLRNRALESTVNAVVITRASGDFEIEYVNPAFENLTGYSEDEAIGRNMRFLQGTDRDQPDLPALRRALNEGEDCTLVLRNYSKDGTLFWNELRVSPVSDGDGGITHFVGVINDITAAKSYQDELTHQATHDILTGVPNRNLLEDRLNQTLAVARRHGRLFALVFIDLDHFKHINDGLGHKAGDAVLLQVSARLRAVIRSGDTLARYAGDEFVVILNELQSESAIGDAILRLRNAISRPVTVEDRELIITASMGVSVYPSDGNAADELMRNADAAMYQAKQEGRDGFRFFTHGLSVESHNRMEIAARLRGALDAREFFLVYQPKICLADGNVSGVEALMRWQHPELGIVPPSQFIPLAEETGLIVSMGLWALREACTQIAQWRSQNGLEISVAVNLSARQFRQKDLVSVICSALEEHDVPPRLLQCEVTESAMLHDVDAATQVLTALREVGVKVSLDDFGTGYSSLSYLKRLPIDSVKIDRSFVSDVTTDPESAKIVQAIIGLTKALELTAIAEGVETLEQLEFLQQLGCEEAQGYYYAKPLPAAEITSWIEAHREKNGERKAGNDKAVNEGR